MASIKAKKGNPFEYDTAYSLIQAGYKVNRIDDNTKGIDLIATDKDNWNYHIECKFHKGFSWNQLSKIFNKTLETSNKYNPNAIPILIFKANQQPVLVMYESSWGKSVVVKFEDYFNSKWSKRPKGYKIWGNK